MITFIDPAYFPELVWIEHDTNLFNYFPHGGPARCFPSFAAAAR